MDQAGEAEFPALLTEFKHDVNAYLARTPGRHPGDLGALIEFNRRHASTELRHFGQELFEQAQATTGDLNDPAYREFREKATSLSREAIDSVMAANRLDAVLAPTNNAAWPTSLTKGDDFTDFVASSSPSAMSGYPAITVPGGYARNVLPLGATFFGGRLSEPTLIALGYAFEQAGHVRKPRPTCVRCPDAHLAARHPAERYRAAQSSFLHPETRRGSTRTSSYGNP